MRTSILACWVIVHFGCNGAASALDGQPLNGLFDPPNAIDSFVPSATFHEAKSDRLAGPFNFSWDGKVLFNSTTGPCQSGVNTCVQLVAFGAHPEAVTVDYAHPNTTRVGDVAASPTDPVVVMEGAQVFANTGQCTYEGGSYLVGHGDAFGTFTVVPLDRDHVLPAPVGDEFWHQGTCGTSTSLVRYDFYVYADQNYDPFDPAHPHQPRCAASHGFYRQPGFVIVDTVSGDPCFATVALAPEAQDVQLAGATGFNSVESSISAERYVVVMNARGSLEYTFNPTPDDSHTWTPQAPVTQMFTNLAGMTVTVDGVTRPATDVVPLALARLRQADGTPFADSDPFAGAYPWLSSDASELFYEAVRVTQPDGGRGVTRAGFSAIGRLTSYTERHVDSWANRDRGNLADGTQRTNPRSPGLVPGLWNNWRTGFELPIVKRRPIYPMFVQGETSTYSEVNFDSVADGSDLLYLEMNELVYLDPATGKKEYDSTRTADISGHAFTGILDADVELPATIDYAARTAQDADGSPFFVANKAVAMHAGGAITVASSRTLRDFDEGMSLGFFIRQDDGLDGAGQLSVVALPGAVWASVRGTKLTFTLQCLDQQVSLPIAVFSSKDDRDWKHVAMTYKPLTNTMTAYLDARAVGQVHCGAIAKQTSTDPLTIGPNIAGNHSATRMYWIDQVRLSRAERSPAQLAADALVRVDATASDLPLGLVASELQLAADAKDDAAKTALGDQLFHDVRFSANGKVACVSCHDPSTAFADRRGISQDLSGNPLPRSAPSLYNRAFGAVEMWDGAHSSLDSQATAPFLNPEEMGLTAQQLVSIANDNYHATFKHLYGAGPTQLTIGDAIARYVRSLLSGAAPIDRYLAGDTGALSASQRAGFDLFRGKARCIACHNGPNFTDEQFHRQGFTVLESPDDLGRASVACGILDTACIARLTWVFKTPSLRNIGLTKPYFHNHCVGTLKKVVALYDGGPNDGAVPPNDDPVMRPLQLSDSEQAQLVDFLQNGLTGTDNRQ